MRFKDIVKTFLVYFIIYFICSIIFILLFHSPILKDYNVFMYKGIAFLIISGIISSILMYIVKKKMSNLFNFKDVLFIFIIYCSINMVFFTLIPVTVERSISVFMLSYMESYDNETYNEEKMTKIFENKYVDELGAFEKRFNEQIVTGTITEVENGEYKINNEGRFIVNLFKAVAKLFNMDTKLVYPSHEEIKDE